MRDWKGFWIVIMMASMLLSCNSPKKQKKINDGKLFEKLKASKGYLNALELKRLELDFSLKLLDNYDLSGFDEADTLAYFLRSGRNVWIASCYLENEKTSSHPFFCLKETGDKGFKLITNGTIPVVFGECSYELDEILVLKKEYVFISQKSSGNGFCDDNPLVFHKDGRGVEKNDDRFQIITWSCQDEDVICFKRTFGFEWNQSDLLVHIHEIFYDWEAEQDTGSRDYDLRFAIRNNTIYFRDTVFK